MGYTLEDIEDILFDGSREEMDQLPDSVSYEYNPGLSFIVRFGSEFSRGYKPQYEPNCVTFFGASYAFSK